MRNAGEIEIVLTGLADRLESNCSSITEVVPMGPCVDVVQTLFHYARTSSGVEIYYFHNTIYSGSGLTRIATKAGSCG